MMNENVIYFVLAHRSLLLDPNLAQRLRCNGEVIFCGEKSLETTHLRLREMMKLFCDSPRSHVNSYSTLEQCNDH